MKTYEEKINAIIEYFENNEETFNDCIEELDSYNGYLGDDRYAIEEMKDNRNYIDSIEADDELNALFDELEEAESEE